MTRKKMAKNKEHVRNFYFNTYNVFKARAALEERDWSAVPHAARELLVVINALEWRKRTRAMLSNLHNARFRTLLLTGVTTVRAHGKRMPVSIRTPNCTALHKYFPCKACFLAYSRHPRRPFQPSNNQQKRRQLFKFNSCHTRTQRSDMFCFASKIRFSTLRLARKRA